MRKIAKIGLLLFVAAILTMSIVGCKKSEPAGPVEINLWEQEAAEMQKALDELIVEFQAQNPDITVKRTHYETEDLRNNFTTSAMGDTSPELVIGPNDNMGVFVPGGFVAKIDDVMGSAFLNRFSDAALENGKYFGEQYMIPDRIGNELLLIYNKDLVPTAPKTFEELIEISNQLKAEGKVDYGLVFNKVEPFFTLPFLKAFGGEVFDDVQAKEPKPALNTPAVKNWLDFLLKLQTDGIIPKEADYDVANNLFKEGKAAFLINGPWSLAEYQKAGMNFSIDVIPSINGNYPAPYSASKGIFISVSVKPEKMEATKKFIEFLTSKESQLKLAVTDKQLPANIEAQKDPAITGDPLIAGQQAQLDLAIPMPVITQMRAIWDAVKPIQQEVFAGKTSTADAGAKMQTKAEEGIKALGF
jgi:arabinogalactan oligomer/maltooligosaccharide transport system substrate-binding protein